MSWRNARFAAWEPLEFFAAEIALARAMAREHNHFKIELAKRTIVRAFAIAREVKA